MNLFFSKKTHTLSNRPLVFCFYSFFLFRQWNVCAIKIYECFICLCWLFVQLLKREKQSWHLADVRCKYLKFDLFICLLFLLKRGNHLTFDWVLVFFGRFLLQLNFQLNAMQWTNQQSTWKPSPKPNYAYDHQNDACNQMLSKHFENMLEKIGTFPLK